MSEVPGTTAYDSTPPMAVLLICAQKPQHVA